MAEIEDFVILFIPCACNQISLPARCISTYITNAGRQQASYRPVGADMFRVTWNVSLDTTNIQTLAT